MTETFVAPATTWALVTITPSDLTTKPVPSPADVRGCCRPKKKSNGSCGAWLTCSVCTVTTDGEILATAFVMAFCLDAET